MVEVKFTPEKVTKNTIRFTEILASEIDMPVIGCIYVPKSTLAKIDYKQGEDITVTVAKAK